MDPQPDAIAIYFEILPTDSMGLEHVEGKLRGLEDHVEFHWKIKDRTFAKNMNEMEVISLQYPEVEDVELQSSWFSGKSLIFKVCDPRTLAGVPGVEMGRASLKISKRSKKDVEKLAKFLDYKVSEYQMERSQKRLDDLAGDL